MKRTRIAIGTTAFLLLVAPAYPALGEPEDEGSSTGSSAVVLGEAQADDAPSSVSIEVNALTRSPGGDLVTMDYTIVNSDSEERYGVSEDLGESVFAYGPGSMSGATLLDASNEVRYFAVANSDDRCICPKSSGGDVVPKYVEPQKSQSTWTSFFVPEEVDSVTVEFPGFQPVEDTPIS